MLKAYSRLFQQLMLVSDLLLVAGCWLLAYGVRFYVIVPPITGGEVPPLGPYLLMLIPILLVWGERDRSVGLDVAAAAHKALPGARLAVIKDAGHAPYFERPPAFNSVVSDFLSGDLDNCSAGNLVYR